MIINRACISINNRCNLNCTYCHFHTPEKNAALADADMDIYTILNNITAHIDKYNIDVFKLGFVGNGEPMLDYNRLKGYVLHISEYLKNGRIAAYTITNGTIINREMLDFLKANKVNVGFSLDGIPEIHNKLRCNSHEKVVNAVELYKEVNNVYPSFNCTVGKEVLDKSEETIAFFKRFGSRITFSRMIGENGISLEEYHLFLDKASEQLNVRTGGYDCTMYGGKCGAGINNVFYANGKIYICGNCVDLPTAYKSSTPLDEIDFKIKPFDRNHCYKEERI